jgi:MtN3 and saliva related transmembrane protein
MSVWVEILGCVAGLFTSGSYLPQLIKLLNEKNPVGVSYQTYWFSLFGSTLWVIYGLVRHSKAVVIFNGFNIIISVCILVLIYRYNQKNKSHPSDFNLGDPTLPFGEAPVSSSNVGQMSK